MRIHVISDDTANPNSWTTAEVTVLARSSADIILVQETKRCISAEDPYVLSRAADRKGWKLLAQPGDLVPSSSIQKEKIQKRSLEQSYLFGRN